MTRLGLAVAVCLAASAALAGGSSAMLFNAEVATRLGPTRVEDHTATVTYSVAGQSIKRRAAGQAVRVRAGIHLARQTIWGITHRASDNRN